MEYITHTRFKQKAICGEVNIPALTPIKKIGNMLYWQGKPICYATSENAYNYFARNDDGEGTERGFFTIYIKKQLALQDEHYQDRWDKIQKDTLCQKYKRQEHSTSWLWNFDFYNAPI